MEQNLCMLTPFFSLIFQSKYFSFSRDMFFYSVTKIYPHFNQPHENWLEWSAGQIKKHTQAYWLTLELSNQSFWHWALYSDWQNVMSSGLIGIRVAAMLTGYSGTFMIRAIWAKCEPEISRQPFYTKYYHSFLPLRQTILLEPFPCCG